MRRKAPGIVLPDGQPAWVTAGQVVGTEHLNAGLDWTRKMHAALTEEHAVSGRHNRGFQARAVLHGLMPWWGPSSIAPGEVYPDSCIYEHRQDTWDGPGPLWSMKDDGVGEVVVTMAVPMPSANYFGFVSGFPVVVRQKLINQDAQNIVGRMRVTPVSDSEFRLSLWAGTLPFRQQRTARAPFMVTLFGM